MSSSHMHELIDACHAVATALDAAADAIVGMKLEAIGELVGLAATFVADQAAAVATFGLAEAGLVLIDEAAEKLVDFLAQQLEQYIIGQVIEAAVSPLIEVVGRAVGGLVYQAAESALGGGGKSAGNSFEIHPDVVALHAQTMRDHADAVTGHAQALRSKIAGVSFE